jgi:hypothetical protein
MKEFWTEGRHDKIDSFGPLRMFFLLGRVVGLPITMGLIISQRKKEISQRKKEVGSVRWL